MSYKSSQPPIDITEVYSEGELKEIMWNEWTVNTTRNKHPNYIFMLSEMSDGSFINEYNHVIGIVKEAFPNLHPNLQIKITRHLLT